LPRLSKNCRQSNPVDLPIRALAHRQTTISRHITTIMHGVFGPHKPKLAK
jgi:hypothetical protein